MPLVVAVVVVRGRLVIVLLLHIVRGRVGRASGPGGRRGRDGQARLFLLLLGGVGLRVVVVGHVVGVGVGTSQGDARPTVAVPVSAVSAVSAVVRCAVIIVPASVSAVSAVMRRAVVAPVPVVRAVIIVVVPVSVSAHFVLAVILGLLSLGV